MRGSTTRQRRKRNHSEVHTLALASHAAKLRISLVQLTWAQMPASPGAPDGMCDTFEGSPFARSGRQQLGMNVGLRLGEYISLEDPRIRIIIQGNSLARSLSRCASLKASRMISDRVTCSFRITGAGLLSPRIRARSRMCRHQLFRRCR
jgi:hypothetical protein